MGRLVVRSGAEARASHIERSQLFELPKGAVGVFTVRNRREGDRFQPLGMSKSKKLKDFLIDRKVASEVRDLLPLLLWEGRIVWIPGIEIAEPFKVTAQRNGDVYEATIENGP
jgi:tRNA(Ile)-lysidine synthase